jgi:hypothetical protein
MTITTSLPLSEQFYKRQLTESNTVLFTAIIFVFVLLFTVISVVLTLRAQYTLMFANSVLGSDSFALMCAVAHTYPFLSSVFFKNRNTPDIVINVFYALNPSGANSTVEWSDSAIKNCGTQGNSCLFKTYVVDPDNWRSAIGTLVWYSESNANYGYDQVMQWATSQCGLTCAGTSGSCNTYCTGGGGMFKAPPPPGGPGTSFVTTFFSYVMPILGLLAMIAL